MSYLTLALRTGPWVVIAALSLLLQRAWGKLDHAQMQAKVDVGSALPAPKSRTARRCSRPSQPTRIGRRR
ncbi:hypothetical protein [Sphingomonas sp.]|uniref:hypothetical protein n=1 Tax=Sphingomonas sp. TaxID=28214 RepID=UPI0025DAC4BE|nr:hypothetical protein [Sphingomonas sp.]